MNKIVYNPEKFFHPDSNKMTDTNDIVEYPVSEAAKGLDGEPIWDANMGTYRTTGRTLEVSIKRGTAVEFESYIADILLDRYNFLEERKKAKNVIAGTEAVEKESFSEIPAVDGEPKKEESPVAEAGKYACKGCGKTFSASDELGLHMGMKHPELLTAK